MPKVLNADMIVGKRAAYDLLAYQEPWTKDEQERANFPLHSIKAGTTQEGSVHSMYTTNFVRKMCW